MQVKKTKSKKIKAWKTKDVVLNVLTYVFNTIIISLLFAGAVYVNDLNGGMDFKQHFSNAINAIHFLVFLALIVTMMGAYFFFEDRDFLKNAVNSQMIFLIIELSLIINCLSGTFINIYVRPLALATLLTLFLTDRRKAIFINIIYCLLTFLFDSMGSSNILIGEYPILIMGFASGLVAVFCMGNVFARFQLLVRSFLIAIPTLVSIAITVIINPKINTWSSLASAFLSGTFAVIVFMALLPIMEALSLPNTSPS